MMERYETVIDPQDLYQHLGDLDWVVIDCRFSLDDRQAGRQAYLQEHIPGAVYASLEEHLSGKVIPGKSGRHPLPKAAALARNFCSWGIDAQVQVVVYDDQGGAYAGRLWWMLRWLGHEAVALLDGGWQVWQAAGYPTRTGEEKRQPRSFIAHPSSKMAASAIEVDRMRSDPAYRVLDARSADRFRGENETRDPVAGHIPGALSAPYADNLDPQGRFLPAEALARRYRELLGDVPASQVVVYCGSGVTAVHDIIAIKHAGLGNARLYPGSWSEWITIAGRPAATGDEPNTEGG